MRLALSHSAVSPSCFSCPSAHTIHDNHPCQIQTFSFLSPADKRRQQRATESALCWTKPKNGVFYPVLSSCRSSCPSTSPRNPHCLLPPALSKRHSIRRQPTKLSSFFPQRQSGMTRFFSSFALSLQFILLPFSCFLRSRQPAAGD